jgi:hypothetical protein
MLSRLKTLPKGLSFYKLWRTLGDLLEKTYRAFHRSQRLGERFKEMEEEFDKEAADVEILKDLEERIPGPKPVHAQAPGRQDAFAGRPLASTTDDFAKYLAGMRKRDDDLNTYGEGSHKNVNCP